MTRFEPFAPSATSEDHDRIDHYWGDSDGIDIDLWARSPETHERATALAVWRSRKATTVDDALRRVLDLVVDYLDPDTIRAILVLADRMTGMEHWNPDDPEEAKSVADGIEIREALDELLLVTKLST